MEAEMNRNDSERQHNIPEEVLARRDRMTARIVAGYQSRGLFAMASIAKTAGEIGRYRKVESEPPVMPE